MGISGSVLREQQDSDQGSGVGFSVGFDVDDHMQDVGNVGIHGMLVDGDLGETTLDLQLRSQSGSGSEVHSASVPSFTDGLP